jgi:hypothetical protein
MGMEEDAGSLRIGPERRQIAMRPRHMILMPGVG